MKYFLPFRKLKNKQKTKNNGGLKNSHSKCLNDTRDHKLLREMLLTLHILHGTVSPPPQMGGPLQPPLSMLWWSL